MKRIYAMLFMLMMGSCTPAPVADLDSGGYVFRMDDGIIEFNMTPCKDPRVIAVVLDEYQSKLKGGVVTADAAVDDPGFEKLDICWLEHNGTLVVIGLRNQTLVFPINHPRMTVRTKS